MGHAREGEGELVADGLLEDRVEQALSDLQHVLAGDEAHLHVDLRVLGLPVTPQVLVPQAACELVVPLEACHHEKLLHDLGRLWKRVELPRVDAARDDVVPCALGSLTEEERGLDLPESETVQVLPDGLCRPVAEVQVLLHSLRAQVEVAVAQANELFCLRVLPGEREGGGLRGVQDLQRLGPEFDLARVEVWVDGLL